MIISFRVHSNWVTIAPGMNQNRQLLRDNLPLLLDEESFCELIELIGEKNNFSICEEIPEHVRSKAISLERFGMNFRSEYQIPSIWRRNDLISLLEYQRIAFTGNREMATDCVVFAELREVDGKLFLVDFGDSGAGLWDPKYEVLAEALNWLKDDLRSDDKNTFYFGYIAVWNRKEKFLQDAGCILMSFFLLFAVISVAFTVIKSCNEI